MPKQQRNHVIQIQRTRMYSYVLSAFGIDHHVQEFIVYSLCKYSLILCFQFLSENKIEIENKVKCSQTNLNQKTYLTGDLSK